jgi:hypothetical protein
VRRPGSMGRAAACVPRPGGRRRLIPHHEPRARCPRSPSPGSIGGEPVMVRSAGRKE